MREQCLFSAVALNPGDGQGSCLKVKEGLLDWERQR
jgi:hypothetical protein